jgi:hypothetical protein
LFEAPTSLSLAIGAIVARHGDLNERLARRRKPTSRSLDLRNYDRRSPAGSSTLERSNPSPVHLSPGMSRFRETERGDAESRD